MISYDNLWYYRRQISNYHDNLNYFHTLQFPILDHRTIRFHHKSQIYEDKRHNNLIREKAK